MLLLEYEGKELLREYGIPTPRGTLIEKADLSRTKVASLSFPAVVKAQVPIGGRGKAGGIVSVSSAPEFHAAASTLFAGEIKGFPVERILVEEHKTARHEYYLAIIFDGEDQLLLIGARGGVDVESYYGSGRKEFATVVLDPVYGLQEFRLREALAELSISRNLWGRFNDIAYRLVRLFRAYDATLAEINPLAELDDDTLIALDARVVIDDGALFRQPRFAGRVAVEANDAVARRMRELEIQYIPLGGAVGLIGSGAGCGVTIMDWVAHEGSKLAAFVDLDYAVLSGRTEGGLRLVLEHFVAEPSVRSIIVNFTACGVRVDLIAQALAKVLKEKERPLKPMFVHFQGNRSAAARDIMRTAGYPPFEKLGDAVRAAAAVARGA
jgi:succinyl-CoA synthetase beta subunit